MAHDTSDDDLAARLKTATVKPDEIYHHYSDPSKEYEIIAVALDEATEQPCIVYRALYGSGFTWSRSVEVWNTPAEIDGRLVPRFTKVEKSI